MKKERVILFLSDGHTTSNNTNPTGSLNGHYNGKVNFDRSGALRINLTLTKNNISYDTYFDVSY